MKVSKDNFLFLRTLMGVHRAAECLASKKVDDSFFYKNHSLFSYYDWRQFAINGLLNESILEKLHDKIPPNPEIWLGHSTLWDEISKHSYQYSEKFIRKFQHKFNFEQVSKKRYLSEWFMREFKNKLNWRLLCEYQTLSESFMWEMISKIKSEVVVANQVCSEKLIRALSDRFTNHGWNNVCKYQNISEEFMMEFADKINWSLISSYQTLSENFIKLFKKKLDIFAISKSQKLSLSFFNKYICFKKYQVEKMNEVFHHSKEDKMLRLNNSTFAVIDDSYILAYKVVRRNLSSLAKVGFQYKIGEKATSRCDCIPGNQRYDEFNFSYYRQGIWATDLEQAISVKKNLKYLTKILELKIDIDDIGVIYADGNQKNRYMRCFAVTPTKVVNPNEL